MPPKKKLKTGDGGKARIGILSKNCTICGKNVTSVCNVEKAEATPTLLKNYLQDLRRHVPEEIQYEHIEDEIACQGCSKDIGLVKNGTEKMEKLQNEISELERTLQEKLTELKSAGKIVLLGYERIEKSVHNENPASNLSQNNIFIRKGTEKASIEMKKTLARLEENPICNVKHLVRNEVRTAFQRPSSPSQIVSVTSSSTGEFEAGEVFQVKPERIDDIDEEGTYIPSEPEIAALVKLEHELVRETRRGKIYRKKVISLPISTLQPLQIPSRNENKEPEVIDMEAEEDEVRASNISAPVLPLSAASSQELPISPVGNAWNCKEKTNIIVKNVAKYINAVKVLKSVRVLNNTWLKETFEKWRSSAVFLINDETFPVLVNAFKDATDESDNESIEEKSDEDSTEEDKDESLKTKDPFQLREFPFKKYRFTKSQAWNYPVDDEVDSKRKLIVWNRCIDIHATYLDVAECIFKRYTKGGHNSVQYCPGFLWILRHSSNVTDLAMAPLQFKNFVNLPSILSCLPWHNHYPIYDYLFDREHNAPQVVSLSMTSPQSEEDYYSFIDLLSVDAALNIFQSLPKLKKLKLPNSNSETIQKALEWASRDGPCITLESIDALALLNDDWNSLNESFYEYLNNDGCLKSLREFKMSTGFDTVIPKENENDRFISSDRQILELILSKGTLIKLEVLVNCKMEDTDELPTNTDLFFGMYNLPNLTHLKVEQEYDTFGTLVTFNLNDLKKMPNLREFHFGIKTCIYNNKSFEMEWLTRKLEFPNISEPTEETPAVDFKLPDLRFFHFHGNFENQALMQLGKIMENLKTLELVVDQENFVVVQNIWPWLINLKLLPCSDIPEEEILKSKRSNSFLNIVDESRKWSPAVRSFISE